MRYETPSPCSLVFDCNLPDLGLSFLTSAHLHTPHAKALYAATKNARVNDRFQEPLYLATELLRAGVLHAGRYGGKTWSGGPHMGSGERR
jgi:Temperature dependent protein affecting M2 dsRNA replication